MSAPESYEDLSFIDKAVINQFEERSTEGIPLAVFTSGLAGAATGFSTVAVANAVDWRGYPEAPDEVTTTNQETIQPEAAEGFRLTQNETGLLAGAFVAAAVYVGIKHRYKKIADRLEPYRKH